MGIGQALEVGVLVEGVGGGQFMEYRHTILNIATGSRVSE